MVSVMVGGAVTSVGGPPIVPGACCANADDDERARAAATEEVVFPKRIPLNCNNSYIRRKTWRFLRQQSLNRGANPGPAAEFWQGSVPEKFTELFETLAFVAVPRPRSRSSGEPKSLPLRRIGTSRKRLPGVCDNADSRLPDQSWNARPVPCLHRSDKRKACSLLSSSYVFFVSAGQSSRSTSRRSSAISTC